MAQELLYPRITAQALYALLLVAPFVVLKTAGWLHPLLLVTTINTISSLLREPLALLAPFLTSLSVPAFAAPAAWHSFGANFAVQTSSSAVSLAVPLSELAEHRLLLTLLYCCGLIVYYVGFVVGPTFAFPKATFVWPRRVRQVSLGVVGLSLVVAVYVIGLSGGLSEHIVMMRSGRQAMFQNVGPLVTLTTFAPLMVLIWFAYEERPFRSPLFVCAAITSALVSLFVTGSRSSVLYQLAGLILIWWHRRGRIVVLPTIAALLVTLAVTGGFGALRQDFGSTVVDWSRLTPTRINDWLEQSRSEMTRRHEAENDLAAFAGARDKGLLLGRSYVNPLLFWLPRAVWPGKPRSTGSYNMWINFAGGSIDEPLPEGQTWGIPASPIVEAFWNFHLAGVIVVALLLGTFHRILAAAACRYASVPAALPVIVYLTINVTGTGESITRALRDMLLLYVVLKMMGAFAKTRRPSPRRPLWSHAVTPELSPHGTA